MRRVPTTFEAREQLIAAAIHLVEASATWRTLLAGCMASETARPDSALSVLRDLALSEREAMAAVQLHDEVRRTVEAYQRATRQALDTAPAGRRPRRRHGDRTLASGTA